MKEYRKLELHKNLTVYLNNYSRSSYFSFPKMFTLDIEQRHLPYKITCKRGDIIRINLSKQKLLVKSSLLRCDNVLLHD